MSRVADQLLLITANSFNKAMRQGKSREAVLFSRYMAVLDHERGDEVPLPGRGLAGNFSRPANRGSAFAAGKVSLPVKKVSH